MKPSKICGRQPLKNLKGCCLPKQTILLQFFKGCLPQILLGLFLNTWAHMEHFNVLKCTKRLKDTLRGKTPSNETLALAYGHLDGWHMK